MKASNFQFTDPSLVSMKFCENKDFIVEKGKEIEIQTELSIRNTEPIENESVVELKINLGDDNKETPFSLEAVFAARFRWSSDVEASKVKMFLNQNAPALLLSYARPIISVVTNASRFPAYNIPFINFADVK